MDFTPAINLATGDLSLDDGELAAAPSEAMGLVVWTLRTEKGSCLVCPDLGVPWKDLRKNTDSAPNTLRQALLAALRWVEEGGWLTGLAVRAERTATNALRYEIRFTAEGRAERVSGEL